jgi:hypothetical protein
MDLVLYLMQYAAKTIEPAVPRSTLVSQEDCVSWYVLNFIVPLILMSSLLGMKSFVTILEWRMYGGYLESNL